MFAVILPLVYTPPPLLPGTPNNKSANEGSSPFISQNPGLAHCNLAEASVE